jgi:hypothetical protein
MTGGYYDEQHHEMNSGGMMWGQGSPEPARDHRPDARDRGAGEISVFPIGGSNSPAGMSRIS